MYVKLRDGGTLFHDISQDKSVTGKLPVELKSTPKVKRALKAGLLVEMKAKDAEAALEEAGKDTPESSGMSDVEIKLKDTLEELKQANDDKEKAELALVSKTSEADTSAADLLKANSDIATLEGAVATHKSTIATKEGTIATHKGTVSTLEGTLDTLNTKTKEAESTIKTLKAEIVALKK